MRKVYGGQFRSQSVTDLDGKERSFMTMWGSLTRDPVINCWKKPRVDFTIRWIKGKRSVKGRFMRCIVWYDNPFYEIARTLKQGDFVHIDGIHEISTFKNREGELKENYSLTVHFLIPAELICNTEAYKASLIALENAEADAFESDGDDEEIDF